MTAHETRRRFLQTAGTGIVLATAGCTGGPDPTEKVDEHRSDLEPYGDVATLMDRDYRTAVRYVATDDGVLGEPLVMWGTGEPDPTTPDVVTFNFAEDGTYEPLALKWFVRAEDVEEPPTLFGREFDGPVEGPHGLFGRHYFLHVWLFRENPDGLFARYHSGVEPPSFREDLAAARTALDPYAQYETATEDGYSNPETCASTGEGAYGAPFLKDPGGGTDPSDPPILRYRITSNWSYVLLGAEWFVPAADADDPPTMFGQTFHEPAAGHLGESDQPEHYGLHAWLYRTNPRGLFAPFNPAIAC